MKRTLLTLSALAVVWMMGCAMEAERLTVLAVSGTALDAAEGLPIDALTIELREGGTACIGLLDEPSCFLNTALLTATATDLQGRYSLRYRHTCPDDAGVDVYLVVDDQRCPAQQARAIACTEDAQVVDFTCRAQP